MSIKSGPPNKPTIPPRPKMDFTTERPVKLGYYWAYPKNNNPPQIIHIYTQTNLREEMCNSCGCTFCYSGKYTHFIGPLDVPPRPNVRMGITACLETREGFEKEIELSEYTHCISIPKSKPLGLFTEPDILSLTPHFETMEFILYKQITPHYFWYKER